MVTIRKKCWPEWLEKFCSGERTFELQLADFAFKTAKEILDKLEK